MRRFLLLAAAVLTVGCSASTSDTPAALLGSWGGPNMQIIGMPSGATVQTQCITIKLDQPVRLDDPAGFTATGTVTAGTSFIGPARTSPRG
jgi:hypothetical protein